MCYRRERADIYIRLILLHLERVKAAVKTIVEDIIELILNDYNGGKDIDKISIFDKPDKNEVIQVTERLMQIVFPGYFRDKTYKIYSMKNSLSVLAEDVVYHLNKLVKLALPYRKLYESASDEVLSDKSSEIVAEFFNKLPKVREYVETDLEAAYAGDPAAGSKEEIVLSYPGLKASTINRLAHELYMLDVPLVPRLMTEYAHTVTGIDIHPGATLGKSFFIDHGTGIVIGESTVIGDNVKIYQGVTLGALSTRGGQILKNLKRHPTIEDNVTIYSGASILGGETVIGEGSVIGGNVFITKSVPAHTTVSVKNQELVYKNTQAGTLDKKVIDQDEAWYYVI